MRWGGEGEGDGQFKHATGIAVDGSGNVFVADYETKKIQKFDAKATFITSWRMGGDIDVKGTPEGIAIDSNGQVYVTDYDLGRIQVFSSTGDMIWAWTTSNRDTGHFARPTAIALDHDGRLFVVNQSGNSLEVFQLP